jgi:ribonuclease J
MELGELNLPPGTFIDRAEADFLEPGRLAYIASGSQGEPRSALSKLATDTHPAVRIDDGDVVVMSSRFIPGNERTIHTLINRLYKRGAEVFYDGVASVHVSGHACRDELAEMIRLTRPRYFAPIHGEYRHLARHLALAASNGVAERDCFLLEDGETLLMTGREVRRGSRVEAGRIVADGESFGDPSLIGERRALAHDGTVIAVVAVSAATGEIVGGPDLLSRGVASGDGDSPHLLEAKHDLMERLRHLNGYSRDGSSLREEITRSLRRYFAEVLGKRPLIVPCVMEV